MVRVMEDISAYIPPEVLRRIKSKDREEILNLTKRRYLEQMEELWGVKTPFGYFWTNMGELSL